jgi:DNA-binding LacI/PurR family transcriptional regulator
MAERAAQALMDAAGGGRLPPEPEIIASSLVFRDSTGRAPG